MSRRNQLLLEFSFWNEPVPREGPNIYELRSYQLRVRVHFIISSGLMGLKVWMRPIMPDATQQNQQGGAELHTPKCRAERQTASRPCKDVNLFGRESQLSCTCRSHKLNTTHFPQLWLQQVTASPFHFSSLVFWRSPWTYSDPSFFLFFSTFLPTDSYIKLANQWHMTVAWLWSERSKHFSHVRSCRLSLSS